MNTLIEILVVFVAVILADLAMRCYDKYMSKKPDINCDNCKRPMLLRQTRNKAFWLCRTCMKAYNRETKE